MAVVTELPLVGAEVAQFRIGTSLAILFQSSSGWAHLSIGARLLLHFHDKSVTLETRDAALLGPVLQLVGSPVSAAFVGSDGSLTLRFAGGEAITVPVDPLYESWELSTEGGLRIVCTAGGELTIWSPSS